MLNWPIEWLCRLVSDYLTHHKLFLMILKTSLSFLLQTWLRQQQVIPSDVPSVFGQFGCFRGLPPEVYVQLFVGTILSSFYSKQQRQWARPYPEEKQKATGNHHSCVLFRQRGRTLPVHSSWQGYIARAVQTSDNFQERKSQVRNLLT